MKRFFFITLLLAGKAGAQQSYADSLLNYRQSYVKDHEVVKDTASFAFFPVDDSYRVLARFERKENSPWFLMESSGKIRSLYRVYGLLHIPLKDTTILLNLYQSSKLMETDKYKDHLFLPFTDGTSGLESYAGGRYLDLDRTDIRDNTILIDFNKAYNPYCAYVSAGYNCPVPPVENRLSVRIEAGERTFGKTR